MNFMKPLSRFLPTMLSSLVAIATFGLTNPALAANAETLASGVVVTHTQPGKGANPTASSRVSVLCRGTLPNGSEFDSPY